MLLHRHRAILWFAFGLAGLNSRGVGLFEKPCFVPDCILKSFSAGTYRCLLKLSVCLKCRGGGGGFCLAGCHVVAQTQGYLVVCIWASWIKFQGGGVV